MSTTASMLDKNKNFFPVAEGRAQQIFSDNRSSAARNLKTIKNGEQSELHQAESLPRDEHSSNTEVEHKESNRPPPIPPRRKPHLKASDQNRQNGNNHFLTNSWPKHGYYHQPHKTPFYTNVVCIRAPVKSRSVSTSSDSTTLSGCSSSSDDKPTENNVVNNLENVESISNGKEICLRRNHSEPIFSKLQHVFDHPASRQSLSSVISLPDASSNCLYGSSDGSDMNLSVRSFPGSSFRSMPNNSWRFSQDTFSADSGLRPSSISSCGSVRTCDVNTRDKNKLHANKNRTYVHSDLDIMDIHKEKFNDEYRKWRENSVKTCHVCRKVLKSTKNNNTLFQGVICDNCKYSSTPNLASSRSPSTKSTSAVLRKRYNRNMPETFALSSKSDNKTEDKDKKSSFDVSRENSIVSEEEVASICGDLRRLTVNSENENGFLKVLASPRVSPDIFHHAVPGLRVTTDSEETTDSANGRLLTSHKDRNFLSVPKKIHRRRSSYSLTSGSEESDCEQTPPLSRRGRRAAIVDTKNFGDVSPVNLSPDLSPSNSCDEGEGASNLTTRLRRRRRSSVDMSGVYPGDLLVHEHHKKLIKRNTVADFHTLRHCSSSTISEDGRKSRQSFSLLKLMRSRSKEAFARLEDVLANMKTSEFKDNYLAAYKNLHWSDLIASSDKQTEPTILSERERKRREAVWELFKSECVFLIDHLMVLKHCFLEPLKKVQVEGHLMYAEPQDLFGNLDEICYVSYTFCKDFIAALLRGMSSTEFGSTRVLLKAFDRFSTHSKGGNIYHTYCLNYTNALNYLDQLRKHDDFCEFEKWCEQDHRCKRLLLTDLLVAPMQHCTKLPLLLNNIRKYTDCSIEIQQLTENIERVESSLQNMEDKMKWIKNYERVQEIQRQIVWPPVTELDPRVFIPEFLRQTLHKQPCERLLACPKRQLLHEGQLLLFESTKTTDVYLFLFDDILLITRIKKTTRKKSSQTDTGTSFTDKVSYTVHKQPVALDRLSVHDVSQSEAAANGVKCAFVIVQISRFQQIIGVCTFQCPTDAAKNSWLEKLSEAKDKYSFQFVRQSSLKENKVPEVEVSSPDSVTSPKRRRMRALQAFNTKSMSVDSVYI